MFQSRPPDNVGPVEIKSEFDVGIQIYADLL